MPRNGIRKAALEAEPPKRPYRRVAKLLGLDGEDEEDILVCLIDEFLALKGA